MTYLKKNTVKIAVCLFFLMSIFVFTNNAWAASAVNFTYIIQQLQSVVTFLLLPIAIMLCAWRIIYLAVCGGMMGIDPLNMISDTDQDSNISGQEVTEAIKAHLVGFVKGLAWIGGLFIVFQIALSIAAMLAATIAENF